jgi:hypothetical protein
LQRFIEHNKKQNNFEYTMTSAERKYSSCFGLINAFVLVNSGYLLEREREREREKSRRIGFIYVMYTRVPIRALKPAKTNHLNHIPQSSFLWDLATKRDFFIHKNRFKPMSPVWISIAGRTVSCRYGRSASCAILPFLNKPNELNEPIYIYV